MIVQNLYKGLTSKIKGKGSINNSFEIKQGVRQGGLVSPFLYKLYVNNILEDLTQNSLGL
jgi:hypothetical protein